MLADTTPVYSSTSTIYVSAQRFAFDDLSLDFGRTSSINQVAVTFSKMIDSEPIAADALARTGVGSSAASVVGATSTEVESGTSLIRVTVADPVPSTAQTLANGLAEAFVEQIDDLEPTAAGAEGNVPALPAYVFERASLPTVPEPTGRLRSTMLGAVLGLTLSVGLVILLDYLDLTAKTVKQIEESLGLPVLGAIPLSRGAATAGRLARAPMGTRGRTSRTVPNAGSTT